MQTVTCRQIRLVPSLFMQRVNAEGRKWVRSEHDSYVVVGMRETTVKGTQAQKGVMREGTGKSSRDIVAPLFTYRGELREAI